MLRSPKAEQPAPLSGAANLEEMVTQYHHQILCLEADLKDKARYGLMRPRDFSKRLSRLKSVQKELDTLRKYAVAESPGLLSDTDIGLPILDQCTPSEHETCNHCMMEKEVELMRIERDLGKAQSWLRDAIAGRSNSINLTFRLSKLRRMIHAYNKLLNHAESEQETIEKAADELVKTLTKQMVKKAENRAKTTLHALMDLFTDLEKTISRVAKLRTALRDETAKVGAMNAWLRKEEARFNEGLVISKPPTPLNLASSSILDIFTDKTLTPKTIKRRQLVEQFWREIIIQRKEPQQNTSNQDVSQLAMTKDPLPQQRPTNPYVPNPSRKVRKKNLKKEGRR